MMPSYRPTSTAARPDRVFTSLNSPRRRTLRAKPKSSLISSPGLYYNYHHRQLHAQSLTSSRQVSFDATANRPNARIITKQLANGSQRNGSTLLDPELSNGMKSKAESAKSSGKTSSQSERCFDRFKTICGTLYTRLRLKHTIPFCLLIGYSILGAYLFQYLEFEQDNQRRMAFANQTKIATQDFIQSLHYIRQNVSAANRDFYENKIFKKRSANVNPLLNHNYSNDVISISNISVQNESLVDDVENVKATENGHPNFYTHKPQYQQYRYNHDRNNLTIEEAKTTLLTNILRNNSIHRVKRYIWRPIIKEITQPAGYNYANDAVVTYLAHMLHLFGAWYHPKSDGAHVNWERHKSSQPKYAAMFATDQVFIRILHELNDGYPTKSEEWKLKETEAAVSWFEDSLGISRWKSSQLSSSPWDLWGSLFYSGTLYTTIGYGHMFPSTSAGRAVTVVYALFGIPLFLAILSIIGRFMVNGVTWIWEGLARLKVFIQNKIEERKKRNETLSMLIIKPKEFNGLKQKYRGVAHFPLSVAFIMLLIWLFGCAGVFCVWENNWSYWTAVYFMFISLTTIGLGDIVPSHPKYMLALFLLVMVGLALVSMCLNIVQMKIERLFEEMLLEMLDTYDGMDPSSRASAHRHLSRKFSYLDPDRMARLRKNRTSNDLFTVQEDPIEDEGTVYTHRAGGMGLMSALIRKGISKAAMPELFSHREVEELNIRESEDHLISSTNPLISSFLRTAVNGRSEDNNEDNKSIFTITLKESTTQTDYGTYDGTVNTVCPVCLQMSQSGTFLSMIDDPTVEITRESELEPETMNSELSLELDVDSDAISNTTATSTNVLSQVSHTDKSYHTPLPSLLLDPVYLIASDNAKYGSSTQFNSASCKLDNNNLGIKQHTQGNTNSLPTANLLKTNSLPEVRAAGALRDSMPSSSTTIEEIELSSDYCEQPCLQKAILQGMSYDSQLYPEDNSSSGSSNEISLSADKPPGFGKLREGSLIQEQTTNSSSSAATTSGSKDVVYELIKPGTSCDITWDPADRINVNTRGEIQNQRVLETGRHCRDSDNDNYSSNNETKKEHHMIKNGDVRYV